MRLRGGCPADEQGYFETLALHFTGKVHHLVKRRCNESGQADQVCVGLLRGLQYVFGGHHDAEIYHFKVIALQHDADDVLADVVNVALHGRHDHRSFGASTGAFLLFDEGYEVPDGLFHHPRALDDLR